MIYEKTEWQNGDIITAEKLNNVEDGIFNSYPKIVYINNPDNSYRVNSNLEINLPAIWWTNAWLCNSKGEYSKILHIKENSTPTGQQLSLKTATSSGITTNDYDYDMETGTLFLHQALV